MFWSAKNLDSYQKKITELFLNNIFIEKIISHLYSNYNVQINVKIFKYYLTKWDIKKWVKIKKNFKLILIFFKNTSDLFYQLCNFLDQEYKKFHYFLHNIQKKKL